MALEVLRGSYGNSEIVWKFRDQMWVGYVQGKVLPVTITQANIGIIKVQYTVSWLMNREGLPWRVFAGMGGYPLSALYMVVSGINENFWIVMTSRTLPITRC